MEEFGWLIETPGLHYFGETDVPGLAGWTTDLNRAIRFARREDGERAARLLIQGLDVQVVQHGWASMPPPVDDLCLPRAR